MVSYLVLERELQGFETPDFGMWFNYASWVHHDINFCSNNRSDSKSNWHNMLHLIT
jgi:hypothetical protein